MIIIDINIFLILIKYSLSKTSIITYPLVDLIENSPINTSIISLTSSSSLKLNKRKYVLLNINEYETDKFEIRNENIYTKNEIDREEFIEKNYCLNNSYCQIEVHIIVNDGLEYIIIPIHIIE